MQGGGTDREFVVQAVLFVVFTTLVLTAAFLGLLALATGQVVGVENRLPFYVLSMAIAFVGAILAFEAEFEAGRRVISTAGSLAVAALVLVSLGGEGVAFAVRYPGDLVASQVLFYLLAAGLIGTGIGYWALLHWREFTRPRTDGL